MKDTLKHVLLLSGILLIGACQSGEYKPGIRDVVVISPPEHLLTDCDIPSPPDRELYTRAQWEEKEKIWMDAMMAHYRSGRQCNTRMRTIRQWVVEQRSQAQRGRGEK